MSVIERILLPLLSRLLGEKWKTVLGILIMAAALLLIGGSLGAELLGWGNYGHLHDIGWDTFYVGAALAGIGVVHKMARASITNDSNSTTTPKTDA